MAESQDVMITRLEGELSERNAFIQGLIENANSAGRDLVDAEKENITHARDRIGSLNDQIKMLSETRSITMQARERAMTLQREISNARREVDGSKVEYRSAGDYMLDLWRGQQGNPEALERIEAYNRAAAHQKTSDNPGVIPDPIIGEVVKFIDAARPLVSFCGIAGPVEAPTFYRPKVTGNTSVAIQGTAGSGSANEKVELVSEKMTISRVTGTANTYGGYVNVSRQNIDFTNGRILDQIVNDLAAQYAITTEGVFAAALVAAAGSSVGYGLASAMSQTTISKALWAAAGDVYAVTKGQGRLFVAVSPGVLENFGPLFLPYNATNTGSAGLSAAEYGQGPVGTISGLPVIMSSALGSGTAYVASTSAVEAYEQRIGQLQAVEPSVLGLQVAYAGYFGTVTMASGAVIPLTAA